MKLAHVIESLREELVKTGVINSESSARVELSFVARKTSEGIVCEVIDGDALTSARPESVHRLEIELGNEPSADSVSVTDTKTKKAGPPTGEPAKKPRSARVPANRLPEWLHSPFTIEEVPIDADEVFFDDEGDPDSLDSPAIFRRQQD